MGIPRFYAWLKRQNYPNVMQKAIPGRVNVMVFDMNSLFHQALQMTYGYGDYFTIERAKRVRTMESATLEKEFYNTLITLLINAVTRVMPEDIILLAVDGVAPQAKIQQQRQRRYRGPRVAQEEENWTPEEAALRKPIIDPNIVTPGTDFMFRLDDFLRKWLENPSNRLQMMSQKIIYSSHLVPGEGEHKYLELLRSGDIPTTGVHVVYGLDADLFILSMVAPVDKIYITREDVENVVSISSLRLALYRLMRTDTSNRDFALLTFLIGNDFLPHQPSLLDMKAAFDTLLSTYGQLAKPLTQRTDRGHEIIWENLLEFFRQMANNEPTLLAEEAIKGFKYDSPSFQESLQTISRQEEIKTAAVAAKNVKAQQAIRREYNFYPEAFRSYWYQHALGPRGEVDVLEFLMGRPIYPVTEDRIVEMIQAYLDGLAWNLAYYLDGWQKISKEYIYPYHHAPLFQDLRDVLEAISYDQLATNTFSQADYPFNPVHQLLAVLPFESQNLLPPEVKGLMDLSSPIYDMFPNQFLIDREGTNKAYEGIPLLPFSESERIIEAVSQVPFPEKRWEKYLPGDDYVVTVKWEDIINYKKRQEQIVKIQKMFPVTPQRKLPKGGILPKSRGPRVIEPPPKETKKSPAKYQWQAKKISLK